MRRPIRTTALTVSLLVAITACSDTGGGADQTEDVTTIVPTEHGDTTTTTVTTDAAGGEITTTTTTSPSETTTTTVASYPDVEAAASSVDEALAEARGSDSFVAELDQGSLADALEGLTLEVRPEVQMDAGEFVELTSLDRQPDLTPLFDENPAVVGDVEYREPIVLLDDTLVIGRELTYELEPDACLDPETAATLGTLCFTIDATADMTADVEVALAEARAALAELHPTTPVAPGSAVTAEEALAMSDEDLAYLMLNMGPRSVERVSVVPLRVPRTDVVLTAGDLGLEGLVEAEPRGTTITGGLGGRTIEAGVPEPFDTNYLLAGFTWGKHYEDTWKYTFAEKTWWHGEYYIKFSYDMEFCFGVRAPMAVDVDFVSGDPFSANMNVAVKPVDLTEATAALGLPNDRCYDDDEFVLEFHVACRLEISIPGPDPDDLTCQQLADLLEVPTSVSASADIDWPIGDDEFNLKDWWLTGDNGEPLYKLLIAGGLAWAGLDVGAGLDVVDGRIGLLIEPTENTALDGVPSEIAWFTTERPHEFTVHRVTQPGTTGFTIGEPHYAFDIALRPKVRLWAGVDVGIYKNAWNWVWPLDFLGLRQTFELGPHTDTIQEHEYPMLWNQFDEPKIESGR